MSDKSIHELLRTVDPARGLTEGLDPRAERDLGKILRSSPSPSRARRRRRLAAVLVAGAATLAVVLFQPWASPSAPGNPQAGTPPMLQYGVTDKTPAGPEVRAALLTVLAGQRDIRAEGSVTDRDGRPGVAFSLLDNSGLPDKTTYIFDRRTGVLLDIETMLTETAGKLNVPIPSVISYEVYESRDYVDEVPR